MTKPTVCEWCRRPIAVGSIGRPRRYCKRSCRQRAYEARVRAGELGLSDDELVVTRNELDDARDRLYLIAAAMSDANDDVASGVAAETVLERLVAEIDGVIGQN